MNLPPGSDRDGSDWRQRYERACCDLESQCRVLAEERARHEQLVAQMAEQRRAGKEIIFVTSGAVGAGMGALGYEKRPSELAELQACAAVGQSRLMAIYEQLMAGGGGVSSPEARVRAATSAGAV